MFSIHQKTTGLEKRLCAANKIFSKELNLKSQKLFCLNIFCWLSISFLWFNSHNWYFEQKECLLWWIDLNKVIYLVWVLKKKGVFRIFDVDRRITTNRQTKFLLPPNLYHNIALLSSATCVKKALSFEHKRKMAALNFGRSDF